MTHITKHRHIGGTREGVVAMGVDHCGIRTGDTKRGWFNNTNQGSGGKGDA